MLKLLKNLTILLMILPPLYIAIRFFIWSLKSLEKEMAAEAVSSHRHEA